MKGCCISFDSYIKPQHYDESGWIQGVVYLLTPTSNHNRPIVSTILDKLYIFWLLHQTTTQMPFWRIVPRCISFDSYIKPQLMRELRMMKYVVYLLTPTSNHNIFLVSTYSGMLYIFWLLHQTTTVLAAGTQADGCISFDSYIKPQRVPDRFATCSVVYLLTPTSNHNGLPGGVESVVLYIFWLLHQTTTYRFENTEFQRITFTFSNKKWWVGYIFQCKSTKKTPIE